MAQNRRRPSLTPEGLSVERIEIRAEKIVIGARDEFHLAAIVQNLKTLAKHLWRPPPNEPAACLARTINSLRDFVKAVKAMQQV